MEKGSGLCFISLVIALSVVFIFAQTQDFSQYEKLKNPQIRKMPDKLKMLVAEKKGDPNVVAGMAFSTLFSTFFAQPGVKMAPPRARWLNAPSDPRNEWVGLYALPLPESVETLRSQVEGVKIDYWEYGEVAEILHIGAYSDETPTIEKLFAFIAEQGYKITGPHEEEYLRGPESGTDTSKYLTIIRYQVSKR
jgi:hypothetical protein